MCRQLRCGPPHPCSDASVIPRVHPQLTGLWCATQGPDALAAPRTSELLLPADMGGWAAASPLGAPPSAPFAALAVPRAYGSSAQSNSSADVVPPMGLMSTRRTCTWGMHASAGYEHPRSNPSFKRHLSHGVCYISSLYDMACRAYV